MVKHKHKLCRILMLTHPDIGVILITAFGSPEVQNEVKQLDLSKMDLSKVEINIEGQDLTKPFTETVSTARPEEINIQY